MEFTASNIAPPIIPMVRELLGGVAVDPSAAKVCRMSVFHSIITSDRMLAVRRTTRR